MRPDGNRMIQWLIFYDDGCTFSSDDGAWKDAPARGVQAIVYEHPDSGWAICQGGDFFRLDTQGRPVALDRYGMLDYVADVLGIVKVGRMLSQIEYAAVYQRAKAAMAGLRKTGWLRRERRID